MAISDPEFQAWLQVGNTQYRNILVEATCNSGGSEITVKLSQRAFNDYIACLRGGLNYSESLAVDGQFSLNIGDLEIINPAGKFDYVLDYIWTNRRILVLLGDVRWARADYRVVLDGTMIRLDSKDSQTLNIQIADKLQRLNAPLTETKLGGTGENKDAIIPFTLGECCNITPLLVDPLTRTYQVHPGAINDVPEARADEFPISITKDVANGKFSATYTPIGTVTCTVQGHKHLGAYSNTVANLCYQVAIDGGKAGTRFTDADCDLTQLTTFNTAHPQPVGYFNNSQDNQLTCMQNLAASIGAQIAISRSGLMKILTLDVGTPVKTIAEGLDFKENSLQIIQTLEVVGSVKLGFCKNWTPQARNKSIQIPTKHQDLWATDWRTVTRQNSTVTANYKLQAVPQQEDTYLIVESDAIVEADRRLAFRSTQKRIYQFVGLSSCLQLELGQTITLKHKRFGLSSGKNGVIVSLSFDWFTYTVTVGVLI